MARKKAPIDDPDDSGQHDRPWVYFMIDAFFLVTQFFVVTFHVKADELILPSHLPPGGTVVRVQTPPTNKEQINLHVAHNGNTGVYSIIAGGIQQDYTLNDISIKLTDTVSRAPEKYMVRVGYEANVPFGDVMAIFNICKKIGGVECGLMPLRGDSAPAPAPR